MQTLTVVRPGLLTTLQDLGRWGHQHLGIPVAGPMDDYSHRLANRLAGNADDAATLELTLAGPELRVDASVSLVVAGAECEVAVDKMLIPAGSTSVLPAGALVRIGGCRRGARAYVAVAGGFDTPLVLGSRATHLLSRMGGVGGRALRAGDVLSVGQDFRSRADLCAPPSSVVRGADLYGPPSSGVRGTDLHGPPFRILLAHSDLLPPKPARLRVLAGPHPEAFDGEALDALVRQEWRVSTSSDRTGYKLEGVPLPRARGSEPFSEPVAFGAIQVPPSGEPILLMADRQTAGGYPKIASIISADLPMAGQLGPGDRVTFAFCTRDEARRALLDRDRRLGEQLARLAGNVAR